MHTVQGEALGQTAFLQPPYNHTFSGFVLPRGNAITSVFAPLNMLWMLRFLAAGAALMTPASSSDPITTAGERQFLPNSYPVENGVSTTLSVSTRANTWSAEASTLAPHQDTGEDEGRGRSLLHKVGCHGRRCAAPEWPATYIPTCIARHRN